MPPKYIYLDLFNNIGPQLMIKGSYKISGVRQSFQAFAWNPAIRKFLKISMWLETSMKLCMLTLIFFCENCVPLKIPAPGACCESHTRAHTHTHTGET